jgi:hypothetical protein
MRTLSPSQVETVVGSEFLSTNSSARSTPNAVPSRRIDWSVWPLYNGFSSRQITEGAMPTFFAKSRCENPCDSRNDLRTVGNVSEVATMRRGLLAVFTLRPRTYEWRRLVLFAFLRARQAVNVPPISFDPAADPSLPATRLQRCWSYPTCRLLF